MSLRTLLVGAAVLDGLGHAPDSLDVLVADGRVAGLIPRGRPTGEVDRVIDVAGRIVCPGFVDIHTHSDLTLLSHPTGTSKLLQGVTTEVVGNCGLGLAPTTTDSDAALVREAAAYLDLDPSIEISWHTVADYLGAVEAARPRINVATFAAHLPMHGSIVGFDDTPARPAQLRQLQDLLDAALDDGAVGVSTGLAYAPLGFAAEAEFLALGEVVARRDRVFAWHVRDYSDHLEDSVELALRVAERTGCRVQISHLAAVGRRNWGKVRRVLSRIDQLRSRGLDIGVDAYPYLAGNAPLSQLLPMWAQAGGAGPMRQRLAVAANRAEIRAQWAIPPGRAVGWDEIFLVWLPELRPDWADTLIGASLADAAAALGTEPDALALDCVAEFGNSALMVAFGRDRADVEAVLSHPAAVVASDGQALADQGPTATGIPHPRSYGTFPQYLANFATDLAAGVARCTSAAADRVGLSDRGRLMVGAPADLVVFDPDRLADRSSYTDPRQHPAGIDHVFVGGAHAVEQGRATGAAGGAVLRPS